jgi:phosphopantothenoylcysteine decarboxylase/phosphopantothenate--cysteine ligase
MSEGAKKFVTPLLFETLTGEPVLHAGNERWDSEVNHIGYARWADLYIVAPATANTLNKAASGIADTLPLQVYLATTAPVLFAPAANTKMFLHPATQRSLARLNYISPGVGELACGEVGAGRLADPVDIYWRGLRELSRQKVWKGRKVVVTAGGSREPIDDVRCITNFSSGKMGEALAKSFYLAGAEVVLISSASHPALPSEIKLVKVERAEQFLEKIVWEGPDLLVMAAAIADYRPSYTPGKLKKEEVGEELTLTLRKNIDILESLKPFDFIKVGFKAEVEQGKGEERARRALERKGLDAICLNYISEHYFGSDRNRVILITPTDKKEIPTGSKLEVAQKIVGELESLVAQRWG